MKNTSTATMRRAGPGLGPLQIAIAILVAATALVHLFNGASLVMTVAGGSAHTPSVDGISTGVILAVLFLCNFCGYVVLTTALYLPVLHRFQHVTRVLLIGFTAVTFIAYFAIDRGRALNPFGLADKAVEAALIVLLIIDGRRARD